MTSIKPQNESIQILNFKPSHKRPVQHSPNCIRSAHSLGPTVSPSAIQWGLWGSWPLAGLERKQPNGEEKKNPEEREDDSEDEGKDKRKRTEAPMPGRRRARTKWLALQNCSLRWTTHERPGIRKSNQLGKFTHSHKKTPQSSHYFPVYLFLFIVASSPESALCSPGQKRGWVPGGSQPPEVETTAQSGTVGPALESLQADKAMCMLDEASHFSQYCEALSGSFPSFISRMEQNFHMIINQSWVQQTCPTIPKYNKRNRIINHPISSGNITELLEPSIGRDDHRSTSHFP